MVADQGSSGVGAAFVSSSQLIEVALPVVLDQSFSYRVPGEWPEAPPPGTRVLVPFGRRVVYGVVRPVQSQIETGRKYRDVLAASDEGDASVALDSDLVQLCEWISSYYLAPIGESYRLALPGLLSHGDARLIRISKTSRAWIESQRRAQELGPLWEAGPGAEHSQQDLALSSAEGRVLSRLGTLPGARVAWSKAAAHLRSIPAAMQCVQTLAERELLHIEWDIQNTQKLQWHVRRSEVLRGAQGSEKELLNLVGPSKQRRALLDFLDGQEPGRWISQSEITAEFPRAKTLCQRLLEHDLVQSQMRPAVEDRFDSVAVSPEAALTPSPEQQAALDELYQKLDSDLPGSALLWGVTGSGKTEVYLRLIEKARQAGRGAIVLVPEIALTPQLAGRFRARFGDDVAVLHSGLSDRQRLKAWLDLRSGKKNIAIGPRSAVFAPVLRLGVIVVDEEHDGSFKQDDAVRYHGRDVALMRGKICKALVVLGSATPSLESWSLAQAGRHLLLRLAKRVTKRPLPEVELLDLKKHQPDKDTMMSAYLSQALQETVASGDQAILFLNRRGFTTMLRCTACGLSPQCPDCSGPSLTYHRNRHRLMCHLCGHFQDVPPECPSCHEPKLRHLGAGTEKVETALAEAFPDIRMLRLDRDTSRGRRLEDLLQAFRERQADVLVGTQMLSKGHDFPGVTLVGVLQADHGLGLPDPRSAERVFQLLTQVAGRAGRGQKRGRVIVQSWSLQEHPLPCVSGHDYQSFVDKELEQREELSYPPFGYLAMLRVAGPDAKLCQERVQGLYRRLQQWRADEAPKSKDLQQALTLMGPVPSPIERVNKRYRWQLLLRAAQRSVLRAYLRRLRPFLGLQGSGGRQSVAVVDVDPQHFM